MRHKTLVDNVYYQDEFTTANPSFGGLGSTSHIANANGALLEYYKYDLYGKPTYWDASTPSSQLICRQPIASKVPTILEK